jgi:peptidoglycan hydrolase CwlO-like protein
LFAPTRAALAATLVALFALGAYAPAHAAQSDAQPSVATLRAQADAMASRYFDALSRYQSLGLEIEANREQTGALVARAKQARRDARERAVMVYRTSPSRVASIVASADALSAARRVRFIDRLNARDQAIFTRLRTATQDLKNHRRELKRDQRQQAQALGDLRDQSAAIDAKLASAQQQEQAEAAAAAAATAAAAMADAARQTDAASTDATQLAAASVGTAAPSTSTSAAPPTAAAAPVPETVTSTTSAPVAQTAAPAPPPPPPAEPASPPYQATPGVHPHHDDPFLSCVRQRESGGNYQIVSSDGLYYGAYQFLQTSWNSTANHAGRPELIGVPPNQASVYDQDDMAWDLYQWQGMGPWGGHCP